MSLPKRCGEPTCLCSGGRHVQCLTARERDQGDRAMLRSLGGLGGASENPTIDAAAPSASNAIAEAKQVAADEHDAVLRGKTGRAARRAAAAETRRRARKTKR